MSKCRITIRGRKIWRDGNNVNDSRPPYVEIQLFRDEVEYGEPVIVSSTGDGCYIFDCLPVWKNSGEKYSYRVDELDVPPNYTKTIDGCNIINTIHPRTITINGSKKWLDNNNASGKRPTEITVTLFQNGNPFDTTQLGNPPAGENTVNFAIGNVPQFDNEGNLYVYTVDENNLPDYNKTIVGFNITNTLKTLLP